MRALPCTVRSVLAAFVPLFSARVFRHAILLVTGILLAPGRRTVTAALRVLVLDASITFQNYHRVLKIARTLADLEGREEIGTARVSEAIQYRSLDRLLRG